MKILVTGRAGFTECHVAKKLFEIKVSCPLYFLATILKSKIVLDAAGV